MADESASPTMTMFNYKFLRVSPSLALFVLDAAAMPWKASLRLSLYSTAFYFLPPPLMRYLWAQFVYM